MKLATIQIKSILEAYKTNRIQDEQLLFLLHDELDFDILIPVLYEMYTHGDLKDGVPKKTSVDAQMLSYIFRRLPKLFVWMYINVEDKLREYLLKFATYNEIAFYVGYNFADNEKVDAHLHQYMVELFSTMVVEPKIQPLIYSNTSEGLDVVEKMFEHGIHTLRIDREHTERHSLYTQINTVATAEELVDTVKDILPHPVIMLSATTEKCCALGHAENETVIRQPINPLVNFTVHINPIELKGLSAALPTKFINRISSLDVTCQLSQDVVKSKYYLTLGQDIQFRVARYTKFTTKVYIRDNLMSALEKYLNAQIAFRFPDAEIEEHPFLFREMRQYNNPIVVQVKTLTFPQYRIVKLNGELVK